MKPGEYIGADGLTRRFFIAGSTVAVEPPVNFGEHSLHLFHVDDLRSVIAALVALADELETEYVEIDDRTRVVLRPGSMSLQQRASTITGADWYDCLGTGWSGRLIRAFRAGQERGKS